MKIAISTVCMPELSWQDALAECSRAGYANVELLMIQGWKHVHPGEAPASEILRVAKSHEVKIVALHGGGLDGLNEQAVAQTRDYLVSVLKFAKELRVGLVNVNGGRTPDDFDPAGRAAVVERIATALRGLAPLLEKLSLRLTLENHFHYQLQTMADYELLNVQTADLKRVGFTVDTGHFTSAGVDIPMFVRTFGPRVFHVHVKDHVGTQSVALGAGQTDNRGAVAALAKQGFNGYLSTELEVHDRENALRYVRESLAFMKDLAETGARK